MCVKFTQEMLHFLVREFQCLLVAACRTNCDELDVEAYGANKGWRIKGEVFWDLRLAE